VDTPLDHQLVRDFERFAKQFAKDQSWGKIEVVFRKGVPMSIGVHVDNQIFGPAQAEAASKGRKPNDIEYRNNR
jgi:hypothetical protein